MTTHAMSRDDESDFAPFTPQLAATIKKVGRSKGIGWADLEDFVHEVWLETRKSRANLPAGEPDRTKYIRAIGRRMAKRKRRKAARMELVSLEPLHDLLGAPATHSTEASELARKLLDAATKRDAEAAEWAVEHHVNGEKQTEIASEVGLRIETVRKRIQRIMAFMREHANLIVMLIMVLLCAMRALWPVPPPREAKPPQIDERQTKKQRAEQLRRRAISACKAKLWEECIDGLDAAKQDDPEGDGAPEVVRARGEAERGLAPAPEPLPQEEPGK